MTTGSQPFGHLDCHPVVGILASTYMQDDAQPDVSAHIDELAPRFEALGLSEIAARLRALATEPETLQPEPLQAEPLQAEPLAAEAPQLGRLLEQQLLSILDQTDQL
jgi:hypothetical protein